MLFILIYGDKQNMKKQIYAFLSFIVLISLPCINGFTIINTSVENKNLVMEDDVPDWELGDLWVYDVSRLQVVFYASGAFIDLDTSMDDFTIELVGYTESSYILKLSGRIKGNFQYDSGEGIILKGDLLYTKVSGYAYFRQNDLANEAVQIFINGIVLLTEHPLMISIRIPMPLTITININKNNPRPFIDFPLYGGKQGQINEANIYTSIKFESIFLRILSIFFADIPSEILYEESYDIPKFNYLAETENISIGSETFYTYNISFAWDLYGSIYYTPSLRNIVKIETVIEIPNQYKFLCVGDLIDYSYL